MNKKFKIEIFSKNLYKLRKNTMSQKKLAEKLGVGINTIRRWEKGRNIPSSDHLVNIAEIFNVSLNELSYWELKSREDSIKSFLDNRSKYDAYQVNLEIGDIDGSEGIILPYVSPNRLTTNKSFKMAYNINMEFDVSGNYDNVMEMIYLYDDALHEGLIEVATNILRVIVRAIMYEKALRQNKKLSLQDKLKYYIRALETINHPAGGYYRAFSLIYKAMETDKTEEENFNDGLILMNELAYEGNGLAKQYLEYIYGS
ncbi:helix-turn-helix domain-containing protein [Clostridium perfringens]|nr:helix-turn-helix domain-containing protein [Clostridium perfringens]